MKLGYPVVNLTLSEENITPNSTIRITRTSASVETSTLINDIIKISQSNIDATCDILDWNIEHGINFYRMSSALTPHISNPRLMSEDKAKSYKNLVYDFSGLNLTRISKKLSKSRLTFHPEPYVVLNSTNKFVVRESKRSLFSYATFLNAIEADQTSVMVLHGGGIYNNKERAKKRWVKHFSELPKEIRSRIVLENDEFRFSLDDVLHIRDMVSTKLGENLPIVLDLFHFEVFENRKFDPSRPTDKENIDKVIESWDNNKIKFHISEQKPGGKTGAHSDYVNEIPKFLFDLSEKQEVFLMIEAKMHEKAVLFLKDKYNLK